jgi:RNA polymerase sigma-70 factor (ECF subfamily)
MAEGEAVVQDGPTVDESDAILVQGLREATPESARVLLERFGPKLFAFAAARFPGDRELAQDLMIQSVADAARNIRRYDAGKATFATWLYAIMRGQIIDELRRRKRRKAVPTSAQSPIEMLSDTSDGHDMAADAVERVHAQRQVEVLAATLSSLELDVLVLNSLDRLSARQIGQVVGRSERAVHSLLHRARMKARERLVRDDG